MANYKSIYTGNQIDAGIGKANTAIQPEDLGELAKKDTVDYEREVTNKPTIPSEVTENTVSGWGFTKSTGTITGITMNGSSKGTSGVIDLGTVITSHQDMSGKENTSNKVTLITSSSTDVQYPSAKAVYDLFNSIVDGDEVSY